MPAVLSVAVVAAGIFSSYRFAHTPIPPLYTARTTCTTSTTSTAIKPSITTSPAKISDSTTAKSSITPSLSPSFTTSTTPSITPSSTKSSSKTTTTTTTIPTTLPSSTTSTTPSGTWWKPTAGTTWHIDIYGALKNPTVNVAVYDIDLFNNPASTITSLHAQSRKVICYFSAGSYENFRPDSAQWTSSDYGSALDGWNGEWWANTNSANVRNIMTQRLDLAVQKGCDGVDPDNIDAYNNDNGLGLTQDDAVNFVTFIAGEAHSRGLAMGLKNGGDILQRVINITEWEVNEQCQKYKECGLFRPLIDARKPVFRIEYPDDAPDVSADEKAAICGYKKAAGFSTLLKKLSLGAWFIAC